MGVGLALVKRLVEMQGAKVLVESAGAGRGTTFTVEFQASEPRGDTAGSAVHVDSAIRKLIRVLVIDDKEDARTSLVSLLSLLGYIVRGAATGEQALNEVAEH